MAERLQLDLPRPGGLARSRSYRQARSARRPRRPPSSRWRQVLTGLLVGSAGTALLVGLMLIPERFDALLLVSTAIANVINGLSQLGLGLLQLAGVLMVALLALLALLLLLGGIVRLARALSQPGLSRAGAAATGRPAAKRTTGRSTKSTTATRVAGWTRGRPSQHEAIRTGPD